MGALFWLAVVWFLGGLALAMILCRSIAVVDHLGNKPFVRDNGMYNPSLHS